MFVKPDLSRLIEITFGKAWFRIDDDIVKAMEPLQSTLARAQNAVRFAWFSDANAEVMHCTKLEAVRVRAGFFRAALAEFVSMEDVLKIDLESLGNAKPALRLNESPNPILHMFRELRNYEIHLKQSPFSHKERDMLWGHIKNPADASPLRISIWILDGISLESFSQLANAKRYTREELCKFVDWLNQEQAEWGIQQLFLNAVEDYCRELIQAFLSNRR